MDKIARVSGRLKELGRFSQQPREFRYSHIVLARDGASESVPRVIMPAALNKMLEIGAPVDLYLARKGPWHFCYAVEVGSEFGESYDGYRLFYVFNRSMMFINIMAGVFLLGAPGTRVAGAGLLAFGVLFAWLGPPTIGRMRAFLLEHRRAPVDADGSGRPDGKG
ncbi:MAG: hypothetical protein R3174_05740 [Gammaproteobacteria bacterium]|nr:hypothetical protein [Gammaproteobacteria bacterium]